MVDGHGSRARSARRSRGGVSRAQAVRYPALVAQAGALARGAASRVLARDPGDHPSALAADAAGHVPAPGTGAVEHLSEPRPTDPIGSIGWTERTGGVLSARECLTLAPPLLRGELGIIAGLLAMALRLHSGRRSSVEPASLAPPDSALARDADVAAQDLLTPALRNHSSRAYTWGAAIAALQGVTFDRELLYLAAMFHDTGIPSPVPD